MTNTDNTKRLGKAEGLSVMILPNSVLPASVLRDPNRLRALGATRLLDTPPETAFDRLTQLARRVLGVPTVMFSLVAEDRQFFKSEVGLPSGVSKIRQTPLTHSICQWVVVTGQPLRIDNAAQSDLVCDNLAVVEQGVRAYFGVPIRDPQGVILGAFAAIDYAPREWTDDDAGILHDFSALAMSEIDLRLAAAEARRHAATATAAELRLAESENRYRTALDGLNEVVFQTDEAGNWTFLSAAWHQLSGMTVESTLGSNLARHIYAEDQDAIQELLRTAMGERGGRIRQELRFLRADGSQHWVEMRARPIFNDRQVIAGISGTLIDINDRYESLTMLTESEVRFRTMVECLGEGLIITDLDDRIQYVNARMLEITGYQPRELLGRRSYETLQPESEWPATRARNRRRESGDAEQYDACFLKRGGDRFWVEVHATPYFGPEGTIVGTLCAVSDISARKAAERRLAEITAELRRSNEALQDFASVASHDLQEPLRKIMTFADRMRHRCQATLGTEGTEYLDRMQNAAGRMQSLINDLLLYSRVSSKGQPFRPVDLDVVSREVVSDLEARVQATGGAVNIHRLPTLLGDPVQIRQLLQNLIGNALKFHRSGTPPVVDVSARQLGADETENRMSICRISIRDNGIGFDPKHAERVFEVFERLNTRTEFEGTGIGLAICRRIVERHGGQIWATSEPGVGTTFMIDFPNAKRGEELERVNVHRD